MQKNFFDILVQTALTVGLFWTILKSTPKSARTTVLYYTVVRTNKLIIQFCSANTHNLEYECKKARNLKISLSYSSLYVGLCQLAN